MNDDAHAGLPVASDQDGTHPRPQLLRRDWADLTGDWRFSFDDEDRGEREAWPSSPHFDRTIRVPFPPESPASGIGETDPHRIVWYHRRVAEADLATAGHQPGRRLLLRFGAVDYRARVFVDGRLAGEHEGGHTPFSLDVTELLDGGATGADAGHDLVVRVEDDPADVAQPRGKQDWRRDPHIIWYHRTTGIWQPVWLESVPPVAIEVLHWSADPTTATATVRLLLSRTPAEPIAVSAVLALDGEEIGRVATTTSSPEVVLVVPIPELRNGQGYEELLWSPERPRLVDAVVEAGEDRVASYLGIRTVQVDRGAFLLNDRPYYLRSVLEQGYWPESHLAAPSPEALRQEVQLIKDLGFNAARLHQKFEDPRLLFWADRLGLVVWGEAPAAFAFSSTAVERSVGEWLQVVRRDLSHPSIAAWVPLNESWGVQHIARDPRMRHYARSLVDLTKALDPTRPVVSNDGWEQVDTDIVAIHDYELDPGRVGMRYRDRAAIEDLLREIGPAGRRLVLSGDVAGAPVMLTEFGGISYEVDGVADAWGYTSAASAEELERMLAELLGAVHESTALAGFCYTQLTDTLQETNGLLDAHRRPKVPVGRLRALVTGTHPDPIRH